MNFCGPFGQKEKMENSNLFRKYTHSSRACNERVFEHTLISLAYAECIAYCMDSFLTSFATISKDF
jgi:hypothetical protein